MTNINEEIDLTNINEEVDLTNINEEVELTSLNENQNKLSTSQNNMFIHEQRDPQSSISLLLEKIYRQVKTGLTLEHEFKYYLYPHHSPFSIIFLLLIVHSTRGVLGVISNSKSKEEWNASVLLGSSTLIGCLCLFSFYILFFTDYPKQRPRVSKLTVLWHSIIFVVGYNCIIISSIISENNLMFMVSVVLPLPFLLYLSQHLNNNILSVSYHYSHYVSVVMILWGMMFFVSDWNDENGGIISVSFTITGCFLMGIFSVRVEITFKNRQQINLPYYLSCIFLFSIVLVFLSLLFFGVIIGDFFTRFIDRSQEGINDLQLKDYIYISFAYFLRSLSIILRFGMYRYGSAVLLAIVDCWGNIIEILIIYLGIGNSSSYFTWIGFSIISIGSFIYLVGPDHQPRYSTAIEKLLQDSDKQVTLENLLADPKLVKISLEEIEIGPLIGRGSFGQVYRGSWRFERVALKLLDFTLLELDESIMKDFLTEIRIMNALDHPNIVQFKGISYEVGSKLYLVSELITRGSLSDLLHNEHIENLSYTTLNNQSPNSDSSSSTLTKRKQIDKQKTPLTLKQKMKLLLTAASGMKYLHESKVIHRDLKSGNFLVTGDLNCKVADFGISKIKPRIDQTMTVIGTPLYMAPEVMSKSRYDFSADVYSFGIMMNEVLTNEKPYSSLLDQGVFSSEIMLQVCNSQLRPPLPRSSFVVHLNPNTNIIDTPSLPVSLSQNEEPLPILSSYTEQRKSLIENEGSYKWNNTLTMQQDPIDQQIPKVLIQLIEECWSQDPLLRPTFREIIDRLFRISTVLQRSIRS